MMNSSQFHRSISVNLVSDAINQFNINSNVNDRFDITIDGSKVSGSAYKISGKYAYHHGTLLIQSDLNNMKYLTKKASKNITGGGIDSVRSAVTNLITYCPTITHEVLCSTIINCFKSRFSPDCIAAPVVFTTNNLPSEVLKRSKHYESKSWIYGQTPKFTLSIPYISSQLVLTVAMGKISEIQVRNEDEFQFLLGLDLGMVLRDEILETGFKALILDYIKQAFM